MNGRAASWLLAVWLLAGKASPATCAMETDLSRPGAGGPPTPVLVNVYLADLHEITGADQTFLADVILQAEWEDPRLAGRWPTVSGVDLEAVWHPRLQIVNQRDAHPLLPERLEVDPSGKVSYRQRWLGRFSTRMDLRDFPMDRQRFRIQVVSLGYTREEVDLASFPDGRRAGRAPELSVTDWSIGPARMQAADFEPGPGMKPRAGIELTWEGRRRAGYYAVQVILPLIMIGLMGWTALWVDPSALAPRISVAVTTMLTLIAYRFALGRLVPNLTYLTRFDYFTLGATILVFVTLLVVAACAWLWGKGRERLVHRIDWWARLAFPLLFAALCLVLRPR